jgi:hypothetical protein
MPTIWASLNRDFFTMVSFEAGGLRILHLFLGHFSGYTSRAINATKNARNAERRDRITRMAKRASYAVTGCGYLQRSLVLLLPGSFELS